MDCFCGPDNHTEDDLEMKKSIVEVIVIVVFALIAFFLIGWITNNLFIGFIVSVITAFGIYCWQGREVILKTYKSGITDADTEQGKRSRTNIK